MPTIERQVHLDAAPIRVAAELARSPWRSALRIEPVGAGSRVEIRARIEPEGLASAVEAMALDEVCRLKARLSTGLSGSSGPLQISRLPTRNRSTTMTTFTRFVTIDAPPERVWPALADFGGIATWNPNVKSSHLTSSQGTGPGITRECQLLPVGTVQERVTEWVDGKTMSIEIFEFKNVPAMRSALGVFTIEARGSQTDVRVDFSYEVGLGALGAGMNSMMMKRQFSKAMTGLLAGLKHHVETGEPVDRRSELPIHAVGTA